MSSKRAADIQKRIEDEAASRDAVATDRLLKRASDEAESWKRKYKQVLAELEVAEERAALVEDVQERMKYPRDEWSREKKGGKSNASVIAVCSDWHFEEVVDPKTVDWKNEHNPEIAARRAKRQFQKIVEYTEELRPKVKIDCVVLALLGDFITGYIHEELEESNAMSPAEAIYEVTELLDKGIKLVRKELKLPIVCLTARGNHGRTTKKKRISTAAKNSYEHMMYRLLARQHREANLTGVQWQISDGYHNWLELYGKWIRAHHGDAINYWGGVGGITIPVNKAIAEWNKTKRADLDIFGHYHQQITMGNFICNGSNIGHSAYAIEIKAGFEQPKQAFGVFDGRHGLRNVRPIFTDDVG